MAFGRQIVGGPSRIAGHGPGFWVTSSCSEVWSTIRGLLRLTPNLQEPLQTGQPPLMQGHGPRSTGRGLRVRVVDSLERGFVWGAQAMAGPSGAVCGCSNTSGEFNAIRS